MKQTVGPHEFVPDGTVDYKQRPQGCARCPLPYRHQVHHSPPEPAGVSAEAAALDLRRLGERDD